MITARDRVAGTAGSTAEKTTCAVMIIGRPAAAARANGSSSIRFSRSRS